jgi:DNA-binding NarL/FixJ family response regulator
MQNDETVRVALVEDDRVLRESLRVLLAGSAGFTCVATAASVEEALRLPAARAPQVILLDVHLPGLRGSTGVAPLLERWPDALVVMHTVYEEDELIFESLCNGAVGYVLKRTPPARLLEAIREAREGGAPMSPAIARKVIRLFRRVAPPPGPSEPPEQLTAQETRLIAQLAQGASYAEAAAELGVSLNTVRTHIRSVYEKLHVHGRSAAVAKALRAGLI